ncbi:MAG TPA: hypothetical protein VHM70_31255 [Polyangiaceae bacterium]|jgi:hypothetical protein|nr:hypothetical protein [Polyangiaceae bacterium]
MKNTSILAAAITGLMLGTTAIAHADGAPGKTKAGEAGKHSCKGLNACKGQGGCKTEKHACKGLNECKGLGGCKG